MAKQSPLLADALTAPQQELLATLAHQPVYEVLIKLFDAACTKVNQRLVGLNPEDAEYKQKLEVYHHESRVVNEFCSSVLAAIDFHSEVVRRREITSDEELKDALAQVAAQILRPGNPYGSRVIKSGE